MPLNENPYFVPVMRSIDMIAAENSRIQAEQRAEERQIAAEDRQQERQDELMQKQMQQQEFGDLTKYIQEYEQNVTAGAEPDPDMLKGVVDRRNALIQEGVYPQMLGQAPQVPEVQTEQPKKEVFLSPATARFYGYDVNKAVKPETKRILEVAYRNYFKPDKTGTGTEKDDPVEIINQMRKRSQTVFDKGVLGKGEDWREGIGKDLLSEYQSELQKIETDYRAGNISKSEARMRAVQLGTFDQFLADQGEARDEITDEVGEIKKLIQKALED